MKIVQMMVGPAQGECEMAVPRDAKIVGARMRDAQVTLFVEVPESWSGPNKRILVAQTGLPFGENYRHVITAHDHENEMEAHIYENQSSNEGGER